MSITIDWQTSVAASALHVAQRLMRSAAIVDSRLQSALSEPVATLARELKTAGVDPVLFWSHLLPHSATLASARERVSLALTKGIGREASQRLTPTLAGAVVDIEQSLLRVVPKLTGELELRLPPWRQQWEARGPGLFFGVRRLAEAQLLPERATVVLVHPVASGGGEAFAPYNQVLLEATLTDPEPRLPELVRLGWLLAQTNLDLPDYADRLPRDRLLRAAKLGLVPVVLAAAEDAELSRCNSETQRLALTNWELAGNDVENLSDTLDIWYGVYRQRRPEFGVGLLALDEMLPH